MKNLTKPLEIRHALERKLGHGYMKKFASMNNCSTSYVSETISTKKSPEHLLRSIANFLGCRVHGVFPDKKKAA